jgi:hypothetical protein
MAFPASAFEPPPGAAGKPDTGYPPPPAPMGAVAAQPPGGMPPGGMPPGGMPPGTPGADANAPQAMPPVSPMQQTQVALPAPPRGSKAAMAFVAIIAVVLVGGALTAFFVLRNKSAAPDEGPIAVAAAAESAAASTIPAAATGAPSAEASAEPSAAASAEPAAPSTDVAVKLTCDPACDKVAIDGKDVDDPTSLELAPGRHAVHAEKDGYLPVDTTITLATGTPFEKELKLTAKPAAPTTPHTGHAAPVVKKPCGKFLKRCN